MATNFDTALMYFREAAEGGDAEAQRRLGVAHHYGELGLNSNAEEARKWFQRSSIEIILSFFVILHRMTRCPTNASNRIRGKCFYMWGSGVAIQALDVYF